MLCRIPLGALQGSSEVGFSVGDLQEGEEHRRHQETQARRIASNPAAKSDISGRTGCCRSTCLTNFICYVVSVCGGARVLKGDLSDILLGGPGCRRSLEIFRRPASA